MKILLLQRMIYVPTFGGANKANRLLVEGLAGKGHECRVIAPGTGSHGPLTPEEFLRELHQRGLAIARFAPDRAVFQCRNVEVHAVLETPKIHAYAAECIAEFQPDCVLVSSEDPGQLLLETALRNAPGRVVYIVHTPLQLPFGPASYLTDSAQTDLVRHTAGIITVSHYIRHYIRQWSGLDSVVMPFPVYGPGPFPQLACSECPFVTLVNPCAYKGISIFLDLAGKFLGVRFAAVPTWGTTRADLAALRRLPNITILKPADDIDEIFRQTRVLLMPSLWMEAFPLLPVEAMLRGIPVIASDAGGLPEAKLGVDFVLPVKPIEQYRPQFDDREYPVPVIPEQDIRPWEAALQAVLSDPAVYDRVSASSRSVALGFVAKAGIGPFEDFLTACAQKKPPRAPAELGVPPSPPSAEGAILDSLAGKKRVLLELRARSRRAANGQP